MKLIDLLVKHLGENGGWPIGAGICAQDNDGEVCFYNKHGIHRRDGWAAWTIPQGFDTKVVARRIFFTPAEDRFNSVVSRDQYEAALAASKQDAWDGCDLPTEGIECEVKSGKDSWTLCRIVHCSSAGVAFIYLEEPDGISSYLGVLDCISAKAAGNQFRPIRTEAERKREEASKIIEETFYTEGSDGNYLRGAGVLDAISAGKIPGVKLI